MAESIDIDQFEYLRTEHSDEMEVLQSIYDGDENFKILNGSTVQYKIGENDEPLSILVEIAWTVAYPESIPTINVELFYNQHLPNGAKVEALKAITEEAWKNAGDQQTYTLIEWMKENILPLIGPYVFDEVCRLENQENEVTPESSKQDDESATEAKKESKKEQITKARKRREWDRVGDDGKIPRGHDWVDVVRHLSQTGGHQNDNISGAQGGSADTSKGPPQ